MGDMEARSIPESPKRLREALTALAAHEKASVIRAELRIGMSSDGETPAFTVVVTHSLGVEHERAIAVAIGRAFTMAIEALPHLVVES